MEEPEDRAAAPPRPDETPRKGFQLGNFLVGEKLGEGGAANVYKGWEYVTEHRVAIKVYPPSREQDALQEARSLGRITHGNVIGHRALLRGAKLESTPDAPHLPPDDPATLKPLDRYCDLGERAHYLVMARARETLDAHIGDADVNDTTRLRWFVEAAQGLQAVHDEQRAHQDVKPENLMVHAGSIKVCDFSHSVIMKKGKVPGPAPGLPGQKVYDPRGACTPSYAAPEKLRAWGGLSCGAITVAQDVYSLCATFAELFGGRRRFGEDWPVQGDDPRPRHDQLYRWVEQRDEGRIPPRIKEIILEGLRHDPAKRHESMAALAERLGRAQKAMADEEREHARRRKWTVVYAVSALVALVALASGVFYLKKRSDARTLEEAARLLEEAPSGAVARLRSLSVLSDPRAAWTVLEEAQRLGVAHLVRGGKTRGARVAVSPGGQLLWGDHRGDLLYWDHWRSPSVPLKLSPSGLVRALSLSRDGAAALVSVDDSKGKSSQGGTSLRWWTAGEQSSMRALPWSHGAITAIALGPGGKVAAAASRRGVWLLGPGPDQRRRLLAGSLQEGEVVASLAFAPGPAAGLGILAAGTNFGTLCRIQVKGQKVRCARVSWGDCKGKKHRGPCPIKTFAPQLVPKDPGARFSIQAVAFSPDSLRLLAAMGRRLVLWTRASARVVGEHAEPVSAVAFSPDGGTLASVGKGSKSGAIFLRDVRPEAVGRLEHDEPVDVVVVLRGHRSRVTSLGYTADGDLVSADHGGQVRRWHPAWRRALGTVFEVEPVVSRDGTTVAAYRQLNHPSGEGKVRQILVRRGEARTLTLTPRHERRVTSLALSTDGRLLVEASGARTVHLWKVATGAGRPGGTVQCRHAVEQVAVSPRGDVLALFGDQGMTLRALRGSGEQRQVDGPVTGVVFSARGDLLAATGTRLYLCDLSRRGRRPRCEVAGQGGSAVALSPDGEAVAVAGPGGVVRRRDTAAGAWEQITLPPGPRITDLALLPGGEGLATGHNDGGVRLWSRGGSRLGVALGELTPAAPGERSSALRAHVSRMLLRGRQLVVARSSGQVRVHDLSSVSVAGILARANALTNVCLDADGREAACP